MMNKKLLVILYIGVLGSFCRIERAYSENKNRLNHNIYPYIYTSPEYIYSKNQRNSGFLDKNSVILSIYQDGASGTLEQIGRIADNSLQQMDVGAFVAPLDENKMMNAPVSGDVSSAIYKTYYSSFRRKISDKLSDTLNLADFGALLNGSPEDQNRIQNIYNSLHDGDVVELPTSSKWQGNIEAPDSEKHITWIFHKDIPGAYTPPAGDGDANIIYGGGLHVQRRDFYTKGFGYPANFFYWNDDSNYCGFYCGNYMQNAAAYFRAISGPTSGGNTSPIYAEIDSYGQNPSGSYDVGLTVGVGKFGQNSTWGIVDGTNDFSGKSPGAFASWNEYDVWTNGPDIKNWDVTYGSPQAGHRSVFFVAASHNQPKKWLASEVVPGLSIGKGDLPTPYLIDVLSSDNTHYVWYPAKGGKTGTISPSFPVPARFNATIQKGRMTVSRVINGKIKIGDYVTGEKPILPVQIITQIEGIENGVGVYQVSDSSPATDTSNNAPLYSATRILDGSVIWQFGEELNSSVSSVLFVSGHDGDAIDTMMAVDKNVTVGNAMVDSTLAKFQSNSASLRMGKGQPIDFTGNGTLAGANKHTLDYDNGALRYKVDGVTMVSIKDNGTIISSLPVQLPTMTRAQIHAYPSPKQGMELYDVSDHSIAIYTNSGWKLVSIFDMPEK